MSDDLDALRSRLESSVDVPPFERIVERAEDARHRRTATRSAAVAALAAAATIVAVLAVTTLPADDPNANLAETPPAARPDRLAVRTVVAEPGITSRWSADRPLRERIPIADLDGYGADWLTLRLTAKDGGGGAPSRYDATVQRTPTGSWSVESAGPAGGETCAGFEVSVRDAVAEFYAPARCSPQRTARLRWTVTAAVEGSLLNKRQPWMRPLEFVTLWSGAGKPGVPPVDPSLSR